MPSAVQQMERINSIFTEHLRTAEGLFGLSSQVSEAVDIVYKSLAGAASYSSQATEDLRRMLSTLWLN